MNLVVALLIGIIFGTGIAVSGMINPAKVLNFFDVAGSWDPSLAFVMGGALIVTMIGYRIVLRSAHPAFGPRFLLPTAKSIDARLLGGSAVFGIGWGIAGFCPGGALPALGTGISDVFVFVSALIVGIVLARFIQSTTAPSGKPQTN
ncbi:YeeE/YedE family protein [Acuticoccus kandeliae]|uniref:YeeE/YedE family protein n=1 Tax=Acuticoccus kandeliae TaxID=2073160 RepID=UPI000D3E842F|nr:YeeE/YedE family protein [Acuticoccus kandeliae]